MNRNFLVLGVSLLFAGAAVAESAGASNAINACTAKSHARVVGSASECNVKNETTIVWIESIPRNAVDLAAAQPIAVAAATPVMAKIVEMPSMTVVPATRVAVRTSPAAGVVVVPAVRNTPTATLVSPLQIKSASGTMLNVAQYEYYEDIKVAAASKKADVHTASTRPQAARVNTAEPTLR